MSHVSTWPRRRAPSSHTTPATLGPPSATTGIGHGFTALHFAARHGAVATVAILVRHGADAFARDFYGCTPHHYASLYLHEAVLEILPAMGEEELRRGQNPKNLNRQVRKGAYGM